MAKVVKPAGKWVEMDPTKRVNLLTYILTEASSDLSVRDRFLESPESARTMMQELLPDVIFPSDFRIQFITDFETNDKSNNVIMKVPPFFGQKPSAPPPIDISKYLLCTYDWWSQ
jgi:hypothetical protein